MANYLVLEKGFPYEPGYKIGLNHEQIVLGRTGHTEKPDISFENKFISRKHCLLQISETAIILTDLHSKHGTLVNKQPVTPGLPIVLKHNDRIILAQGAAVLRYISPENPDDATLELNNTNYHSALSLPDTGKLKLDIPKRQCFVSSDRIALSPKEWQLLLLLYANCNQTVHYDDIRTNVWPERILRANEIPQVGLDEINLLIYRLRQKLGSQGALIKNSRGVGCLLEL
ncbi:FHA domain-containing protein [Sporomusa sp.]|uniref:FHA domain-containing protein n=1 Tax=Sporomusa sp. TaxID=2078658 RepID=UPI002CEB023E|nr:FHA domain-containing protein [Sporomusa sp.]HWR05536.1 FHA domain-containing protein [Sporomusa sp.]